MRSTVFHALLIGTFVTLGAMSGCGKKEPSPPIRMLIEAPPEVASNAEPLLVGGTAKCKVYRVYDTVKNRSVYFVEAAQGENLYCGGITTP